MQQILNKPLRVYRVYVIHSADSRLINTAAASISGHFIALDTISPKNQYEICYFDPLGLPVFKKSLKDIINYNVKKRRGTFSWNAVEIQNPISTICGELCVYFLLMRARLNSLETIQKSKFSRNSDVNLRYIPLIIEELLLKKQKRERIGKERFSFEALNF